MSATTKYIVKHATGLEWNGSEWVAPGHGRVYQSSLQAPGSVFLPVLAVEGGAVWDWVASCGRCYPVDGVAQAMAVEYVAPRRPRPIIFV